jgi:pimeloyl-ACP methyl ester carboxylesterase
MNRSLAIASLSTAVVGLVAVAAIALHTAYGGRSVADPASARCDAPAARFGRTAAHEGYRTMSVHFRCAGAVIAGTLTLPAGAGRHPAVVFVHGSGEAARLEWNAPLVRAFVRAGVAVLSYDKRGVGESEGVCCPGDQDQFNLLAADVDGAVNALRMRSEVDSRRIGLVGASQAGWVAPVAAVRSRGRVAFIAVADGAAVSGGEERLYSSLAGEEDAAAPPLTPQRKRELDRELDDHGISGFDPRPFLARLTVPALWLYGGQDKSVPAARSASILRSLPGKRFDVVVYPRAGHGLLDVPASDPRALPALVAWVRRVTAA